MIGPNSRLLRSVPIKLSPQWSHPLCCIVSARSGLKMPIEEKKSLPSQAESMNSRRSWAAPEVKLDKLHRYAEVEAVAKGDLLFCIESMGRLARDHLVRVTRIEHYVLNMIVGPSSCYDGVRWQGVPLTQVGGPIWAHWLSAHIFTRLSLGLSHPHECHHRRCEHQHKKATGGRTTSLRTKEPYKPRLFQLS